MAISEGRFNRLEERINDAIERVARLEVAGPVASAPKTSWPIWATVIASVVTLLGFGITLALHLNGRIDSVKTDVAGLGTRIDKLNSAVTALGDQQSDQTQRLIHDLLTTAAITKNLPTAAKAVEVASQLTAVLRKEKRPASQAFFQSAMDKISKNRQPSLRPIILEAQQQLAEYRSALQPPQILGEPIKCRAPNGAMSYLIKGPGEGFAHIDGFSFDECDQTLDGIAWHNVAFLNSRIIYRGGPVWLDHVLFINCTFDIDRRDSASGLLEYAALGEKELRIGQIPDSIPSKN